MNTLIDVLQIIVGLLGGLYIGKKQLDAEKRKTEDIKARNRKL